MSVNIHAQLQWNIEPGGRISETAYLVAESVKQCTWWPNQRYITPGGRISETAQLVAESVKQRSSWPN